MGYWPRIINIMTIPYIAIDSTMPTKMKTLDCIFGLSLIGAKPAAPTNPSPIPAPAPARPKAKPAPMSLAEPRRKLILIDPVHILKD